MLQQKVVISLNPRGTDMLFSVIHYNRGVDHFEKGEYDRAIEDFTKALELNPEYVDAYRKRGVAYIKKGEYPVLIIELLINFLVTVLLRFCMGM